MVTVIEPILVIIISSGKGRVKLLVSGPFVFAGTVGIHIPVPLTDRFFILVDRVGDGIGIMGWNVRFIIVVSVFVRPISDIPGFLFCRSFRIRIIKVHYLDKRISISEDIFNIGIIE